MSKSIDELFAEVARTEDRAILSVLADALVERGDPRGELMQVQLALDGAEFDPGAPPWPRAFPDRTAFDRARDDRGPTLAAPAANDLKRREQALVEARTAALLGELPPHHGIALHFRYGLLDKIRVGFSTLAPEQLGAELARLLASPEARMIRVLELDPPHGRSEHFRRVFAELAARGVAAPSLKTVACGSLFPGSDYQYSPGEDPYDDPTGALVVFPALEELWVHRAAVELAWSALASPALHHFTFLTPAIRDEDLAAFANATLPALRSFVMWTGAAHYVNEKTDMTDATPGRAITVAQLEPVFAMLDRCPDLRTFGVGNYAGDVAALVTAIAAHPFAQRIETLDLSMANAVDGASVGPALDLLPALRTVVIDGIDVTNQREIKQGGRALVGGYAYGLARFRYVVHQE